MNAAIILAAVEDYLTPLVVDNKGSVSIAETEEDALEQLAVGPDRWRVILCMDGDKNIGDLNPAGLVEGRMVCYVQAGKGAEAKKNASIHRENVRGASPFLARLHWVIRKVRGLSLASSDIDRRGFRYRGWEWLRYDGQAAFRTVKANFDLVYAHDDPATDPDGSEPVVLPSPFRIVAATEEFYVISLSGTAHGRVPRYEPGLKDPTGSATGYAITGVRDEFYTVAFDGVPHGRIPQFIPA